MNSLEFTVYGEAVPQGSMKAFIPKGWRRPILTSDNPRLKSWRQLVADGAQRAIMALPASERGLLLEGVRLTVAFYLPRPKSLPRRVTANTKKPDIDKCVRSILDSLSSVVFADDSQVVELVATKQYAAEMPHVDIRVEPTAGCRPVVVPPAPLPLLEAAR
jgi:Holliday junction resolvase RusA-like endonuclease